MNRKKLIFKLVILLIPCHLSSISLAQNKINNDTTESRSKHQLELTTGTSLDFSNFRDYGTAPIRFIGIGVGTSIDLRYQRINKWRIEIENHTEVSFCEDVPAPSLNFQSFDVYNATLISYAHYLPLPEKQQKRMQIGVGGGIENFADVTVNTQYENAAVGVSEMIGIYLIAEGTYRMSKRWSIGCKIGISPWTISFRPGYSYIDNYTAYQPVLSAQFSNYQWSSHWLAGGFSDLHVAYSIRNGNRIALRYRWMYHETGHNDAWRFEHASHLLTLNLTFNLSNHQKAPLSL